MARYTVRVELHNATTWQDYDTLHTAMGKEGFSRTIVGSDGVTYELPTAEYVITGTLTSQQVLDRAKRAAAVTGKSSSILVSEVVNWMWLGLTALKRSGTY
jgi:hypothetical protein